jgi:putative tryptophan/tyrosine transport system substrate-binding protein
MRRRKFIAMIGGAAAWPLTTRAQQQRILRIGVLSAARPEGSDASRGTLIALVDGLRELGYVEGQNITIEREFGGSNADRLRELAAGLVKRQVDVIVALSTTAARPAKQATSAIPIVAIAMADPVEDELVAMSCPAGWKCYWDNLSRPRASYQAATIA